MEKLILHGANGLFKKSKFIEQFVNHLSKTYEIVCDNNLPSESYISIPKIYNKKFWNQWFSNGGYYYTAITDNPNQALYWLFEDGCVVQRNKVDGKVVHTEVTKPEQLLEGTIYKRIYKDSQEYRVHVCKGNICAIYLKVPAKDGKVTSQYVKTLATGYKYTSKFPKISKVAIQHISRHITEQFAYTFFAIDFIYSNGKWLVADVIVNPAVSSKTLDRYVKAFVGTKAKAGKGPTPFVNPYNEPVPESTLQVFKKYNAEDLLWEPDKAKAEQDAASVYFDNYFADIPIKKSKVKVPAKPPKWNLNGANASKVDMSEWGTTANAPQAMPPELILDEQLKNNPNWEPGPYPGSFQIKQTTQQEDDQNDPVPF
jgi:hypothetical protein